MKYSVVLFLLASVFSCKSTNFDSYSGTSGSRYGIDPFPSKESWKEYIAAVNPSTQSKESILWVVGSYHSEGIKLSFEGKDNPNSHITYNNFDFNEDFISYFDKNKVDVFLLIEPGSSDIPAVIYSILDQYMSHKSIVGVCIDLEWLNSSDSNKGVYVSRSQLSRWLDMVQSFNPKYKLMVKHWNINMIEPLFDTNVIYIQSMESINTESELKKRHALWVRKFYPSHVGLELGFKSDKSFWSNYENPILDLYNLVSEDYNQNEFSFYWSESSIIEVLESK